MYTLNIAVNGVPKTGLQHARTARCVCAFFILSSGSEQNKHNNNNNNFVVLLLDVVRPYRSQWARHRDKNQNVKINIADCEHLCDVCWSAGWALCVRAYSREIDNSLHCKRPCGAWICGDIVAWAHISAAATIQWESFACVSVSYM